MHLPYEMMSAEELETAKAACAAKLRRIAGLPNPSRELMAAAEEARQEWNKINDIQNRVPTGAD